MGSACDPSSGLQPAACLSPLLGEFRVNTTLHPAEQPGGARGDTCVEATWGTMAAGRESEPGLCGQQAWVRVPGLSLSQLVLAVTTFLSA